MKPLQRLLVCISLLVCCSAHGQIITTVAGNGSSTVTGSGPATAAGIGYCFSGTFDNIGNYYFISGSSNSMIQMVDTFGLIHIVTGTGTIGFSGDGGLATNAQINYPHGVVADNTGNLYIVDTYNRRIRKINTGTHIITTIAGNGIYGYSGDNGAATNASLSLPYNICLDPFGNIYIIDSTTHIRKVNTSGIITTVAGTGVWHYTGNGGPATLASLMLTGAICSDLDGNIYFGDSTYICKIDANTGIINEFAGNGSMIYNGDNINADDAAFTCSYQMVMDVFGNLYFPDYGCHRVRVIDNDHIIHTVAGTGIAGFTGDNGLAINAELYGPQGVSEDKCGNLYIADEGNRRIRKVALNPNCWPLAVEDAQQNKPLTIYPNPATGALHIDNLKAPATYTLYDITGRVVAASQLTTGPNEINTTHLSTGIYLLHLQHKDGTREVHKIVKE